MESGFQRTKFLLNEKQNTTVKTDLNKRTSKRAQKIRTVSRLKVGEAKALPSLSMSTDQYTTLLQ